MPVDRQLLQGSFTKQNAPGWPCPVCNSGYLRLLEESVVAKATAESITTQDHPAWDPDWTILRFVAVAVCDNVNCKEAASIAGAGSVQVVNRSYDYDNFYTPEYFNPSPSLIAVPDRCSDELKAELKLAFATAWGDPLSASAHIRASVERLLDQLRIIKTSKKPNGKRQRLSLHKRIEALGKKSSEATELLLAVKWIGNAGVHTGALTQNEVADALDILERALDLLFNSHSKRVRRLAKKINKRKAP